MALKIPGPEVLPDTQIAGAASPAQIDDRAVLSLAKAWDSLGDATMQLGVQWGAMDDSKAEAELDIALHEEHDAKTTDAIQKVGPSGVGMTDEYRNGMKTSVENGRIRSVLDKFSFGNRGKAESKVARFVSGGGLKVIGAEREQRSLTLNNDINRFAEDGANYAAENIDLYDDMYKNSHAANDRARAGGGISPLQHSVNKQQIDQAFRQSKVLAAEKADPDGAAKWKDGGSLRRIIIGTPEERRKRGTGRDDPLSPYNVTPDKGSALPVIGAARFANAGPEVNSFVNAGGTIRVNARQLPPTTRATYASVITRGANDLGISPHHLATAISFETGGTFNPNIVSNHTTKWGHHIGWIQMGGQQRAEHGYRAESTLDEKMDAIVSYMKSKGVRPGMGMNDIYAAINAGGVGPAYRRLSDQRNGGTPGTVDDKVNFQMGYHRIAAADLLSEDRSLSSLTAGSVPVSSDQVQAAVKGGGPSKYESPQYQDSYGRGPRTANERDIYKTSTPDEWKRYLETRGPEPRGQAVESDGARADSEYVTPTKMGVDAVNDTSGRPKGPLEFAAIELVPQPGEGQPEQYVVVPTIIDGKVVDHDTAFKAAEEGKTQPIGTFPTLAQAQEGAKKFEADTRRKVAEEYARPFKFKSPGGKEITVEREDYYSLPPEMQRQMQSDAANRQRIIIRNRHEQIVPQLKAGIVPPDIIKPDGTKEGAVDAHVRSINAGYFGDEARRTMLDDLYSAGVEGEASNVLNNTRKEEHLSLVEQQKPDYANPENNKDGLHYQALRHKGYIDAAKRIDDALAKDPQKFMRENVKGQKELWAEYEKVRPDDFFGFGVDPSQHDPKLIAETAATMARSRREAILAQIWENTSFYTGRPDMTRLLTDEKRESLGRELSQAMNSPGRQIAGVALIEKWRNEFGAFAGVVMSEVKKEGIAGPWAVADTIVTGRGLHDLYDAIVLQMPMPDPMGKEKETGWRYRISGDTKVKAEAAIREKIRPFVAAIPMKGTWDNFRAANNTIFDYEHGMLVLVGKYMGVEGLSELKAVEKAFNTILGEKFDFLTGANGASVMVPKEISNKATVNLPAIQAAIDNMAEIVGPYSGQFVYNARTEPGLSENEQKERFKVQSVYGAKARILAGAKGIGVDEHNGNSLFIMGPGGNWHPLEFTWERMIEEGTRILNRSEGTMTGFEPPTSTLDYWTTPRPTNLRRGPTVTVRPTPEGRRTPIEGRNVGIEEGGGESGRPFDPEGTDYDLDRAFAGGMTPAGPEAGENVGHMGSVVETTEEEQAQYGLPEDSYLMLKGKGHETWNLAVEAEEARGSKIIKRGDRYFSVPQDFDETAAPPGGMAFAVKGAPMQPDQDREPTAGRELPGNDAEMLRWGLDQLDGLKRASKGGITSWLFGEPESLAEAPAMSAYPSDAEAEEAKRYGFGYGSGNEAVIQGQAARPLGWQDRAGEMFQRHIWSRVTPHQLVDWAVEAKNLDLDKHPKVKAELHNLFAKAALAINRNPVAALGFDPDKIGIDTSITPEHAITYAGLYSPPPSKQNPKGRDIIYATRGMPGVIVHESIHRGFALLALANEEANDILNTLARNGVEDELLVRAMMVERAGDAEKDVGDASEMQRRQAIGLMRIPSIRKSLARLEELAAQELAKKKEPHIRRAR